VFPISHNYILSKLLFSPDSTRPAARILIGKEVRNAEDYQRAIEPLQGRVFAGALLRFWVSDETTHVAATFNRSNVSQLPMRLNDPEPSWSPSFTSATPVYPVNWDLFNSPASAIPPPPIIFSTPPVASGSPLSLPGSPHVHAPPQQTPMDIDRFNYGSIAEFYRRSHTPDPGNATDFWDNDRLVTPQLLGGTQHLPHQPQQPQTSRTTSTTSSCCSVSQGKADIQSLLATFKSDLNRIMDDIFSSPNSESPLPRNSPIIAPAVPGAWPEPLAPWTAGAGVVSTPFVAGTTPPCVNMWCMICGKLFGGPWYSCDKCSWHVLVRHHTRVLVMDHSNSAYIVPRLCGWPWG
jgi:next to BRCA1 gene 1 protein